MKRRIFSVAIIATITGFLLGVGVCEAPSQASDEVFHIVEEPIPNPPEIEFVFEDYIAFAESTSEVKPYDFIPLDDELQLYMIERCNDLGIDFFIAAALMESESTFNVNAVGDSGNSIGLFQINKVWWDTMADSGIDVHEPKGNIEAGLRIMRELISRYPEDIKMVIQTYKCGISRGEELAAEGIIIGAVDVVLRTAEEFKEKGLQG